MTQTLLINDELLLYSYAMCGNEFESKLPHLSGSGNGAKRTGKKFFVLFCFCCCFFIHFSVIVVLYVV